MQSYTSIDSMPSLMTYTSEQQELQGSIIQLGQETPIEPIGPIEDCSNEQYYISDQDAEQQLSYLHHDKQITSEAIRNKREQLKQQQHRGNQEYDNELKLLTDKLFLVQKTIQLYKDRMMLRNKVKDQQVAIEALLAKVVEMETQFKGQVDKLTNYANMLPSQREEQCQLIIKDLTQQLASEKQQRITLQQNVDYNVESVQLLFREAEAAKKVIIEQLHDIKQRKDELDNKLLIFRDKEQLLSDTINRQSIQKSDCNISDSMMDVSPFKQLHIPNLTETLKKQRELQSRRESNNKIFTS